MGKKMDLGNLDVFLVEPSKPQFRIISDSLRRFGIRHITQYTSAGAALAAMADKAPDLVISAMHLPDISGTDLVIRMRNEDALRDLGFILISSETSVRYLEPIRQAGVIAILPKPFAENQLKRALYTTLDYLEPENINLENHDVEDITVLVVDDSVTARHYIKRSLQAMGIHKISEAVSGKDAIALIDKHYYDLIVTDYNMPVMDGYELIQYIREDSNQSGIPVLMITSENDIERLAAIEQAGVSALCDKPFEMDTIRSLIQHIMN